ncbi:hypothetical protein BaRGS_00029095 [Batillaria attramentaria]|uniref:Uncharacterized protein n=1 Tax=Batillaria attramentaria TaxID=370345 RepID=A0ABD0JXB5_9CAEN
MASTTLTLKPALRFFWAKLHKVYRLAKPICLKSVQQILSGDKCTDRALSRTKQDLSCGEVGGITISKPRKPMRKVSIKVVEAPHLSVRCGTKTCSTESKGLKKLEKEKKENRHDIPLTFPEKTYRRAHREQNHLIPSPQNTLDAEDPATRAFNLSRSH